MPRKQLPARSQVETPCSFAFAPCLPGPERIVGLGFRYWMLGLTTGQVECWERAWNLYSGHFGTAGAQFAVGHLSQWVLAISKTARRQIEVFPEGCRSFCRDECVAVAMIAACQHNTCPAVRSCAFALAESVLLDNVVAEARTFADTMLGLDQVLSVQSIVPAVNAMPATTGFVQ